MENMIYNVTTGIHFISKWASQLSVDKYLTKNELDVQVEHVPCHYYTWTSERAFIEKYDWTESQWLIDLLGLQLKSQTTKVGLK